MKLLYITPKINGEGGIEKVLSVKTNYLIEKFDYQIDILTQDDGNSDLFFDFNKKIGLHDMVLSTNKISRFIQFRNKIQDQIQFSNPDVIIVCNTEIKAFILPFLLKTKTPIIYEIHGSKFNEDTKLSDNFISNLKRKFRFFNRGFLIQYFDHIVALSLESLLEWNLKNATIIPNPIEPNSNKTADLQSKKAIVIARHSFEKGIDKLIEIWEKVVQKHPDWILEIYGTEDVSLGYKILVNDKNLNHSIQFFEPIKDISSKYLEASMCLMTSRSEGFPMVLLEAMNHGLPCIAYDCPVGPRAIINTNENGFLIENNNQEDFANAVFRFIENENLRIEMGKNAKESILKYKIEPIMNLWNDLFISLKSNHK